MRTKFKPIALIAALFLFLCSLALALPASADDAAGMIKPFAKHGRTGAQIVFSEEDFTSNLIGKGKLTGILVTSIPTPDSGAFLLGSAAVAEGSVIPRDMFSSLVFAPSGDAAMSVELHFIPLFSAGGGEVAGENSCVAVYLGEARNYAPSAANLTLSTYKNLPIEIWLSAFDHEGDALSYTVVSTPERGELTASGNKLIYTPQANKTGKVSFTYYAQDALGNTSDLATVTVKVEKQKSDVCYSDLEGSTLQYAAVYLAEKGVYLGRTVGQDMIFEAGETLTRGEFIALASSALSLSLDSPVSAVLTETCGWQGAYIAAALDNAIISSARYSDEITSAEAAAIVSRLIDADVSVASSQSLTPAWAADDALSLRALGILTDTARLSETMTRGEAAELLARASAVVSGNRLGWAVYGE